LAGVPSGVMFRTRGRHHQLHADQDERPCTVMAFPHSLARGAHDDGPRGCRLWVPHASG